MSDSKKLSFTVEAKNVGVRLDRFLSDAQTDYSRSWFQRLIKDGRVTLNGSPCLVPKTALQTDDKIDIEFTVAKTPELRAEHIDFPIIFEDDSLIVVNKPPGLVVHPAAGNQSGTLVNALLGRDKTFKEGFEADDDRPGIVHRLDKDTSGCLIVAKSSAAQYKITAQFANRETDKEYLAIAYGVPKRPKGTIETLIGRHPVNRKKMAVVDRNGREATSIYTVLNTWEVENHALSLINVKILTGRTHQIRVHLAHINCPILGDDVYGGKQRIAAPRQMLHAWKLSLRHPRTNEPLRFVAPVPRDFLDQLPEGCEF